MASIATRVVGELAAHDGGQPLEPRRVAFSSSDGLAAGRSIRVRSSLSRRKAIAGCAMARRRIASATWLDSVRGSFRNLSRAGVAKKRSRTSTRVPGGCAAGLGSPLAPPSIARLQAVSAPAGREVMVKRLTEAIDGSASPRKPERADVGEIVVRQLGGAVPLDRELQLLGRHADAVVDHRQEGAAAFLQGHGDAVRAGIDRVLDQLLHGAGRPLDHLAGGDLVDQVRGEAGAAWRPQFTTSAFGKDTGG